MPWQSFDIQMITLAFTGKQVVKGGGGCEIEKALKNIKVQREGGWYEIIWPSNWGGGIFAIFGGCVHLNDVHRWLCGSVRGGGGQNKYWFLQGG